MSFQIRPLKAFLVRPALPPVLAKLSSLGLYLMWSWHHSVRRVFRRLDPVAWNASNHNPVVMLGQVPQAALERAVRWYDEHGYIANRAGSKRVTQAAAA